MKIVYLLGLDNFLMNYYQAMLDLQCVMLTKHYRGNNDGVAKVCNGTDMHTLYMHDILVYFYLPVK